MEYFVRENEHESGDFGVIYSSTNPLNGDGWTHIINSSKQFYAKKKVKNSCVKRKHEMTMGNTK
jgi:hypothetical protein